MTWWRKETGHRQSWYWPPVCSEYSGIDIKRVNHICMLSFIAGRQTTFRKFSASTHWGRVTHICVSKLTIIGSDNGLSPDRRQAIIWTYAGILLIGPLETNFSEILIGILTFSSKNAVESVVCEMAAVLCRPQCINPLKSRDAIWRHISGSTFVQVMPCCLTTPSHYPNKCPAAFPWGQEDIQGWF